MGNSMPTETTQKRGWLWTIVFSIVGLYFLYSYIHTREPGNLLTALGFALILPNTFLHPVGSRRPGTTIGVKRPHPALRLAALAGTICIFAGLIIEWL